MKRLVLGLLCLFASCQIGAVGRVASIPRPFTGEWNAVLASCEGREGDGHVTLSAAQLSFYESVGSVSSVRVLGPLDIVVDAEMAGEGQTWLDHLHFRLSSDKRSLTVLGMGPQPWVLHRCPTPSR
jgi:hypothetical protein